MAEVAEDVASNLLHVVSGPFVLSVVKMAIRPQNAVPPPWTTAPRKWREPSRRRGLQTPPTLHRHVNR